ncbi:UDP-N-acetylglucosamine 1-carboxyvinyltransferase [Stappia indica]|uniref:UDP-N-acetylglucosamine 1-carboxyvinyltransferase n=1 Tax=Stappia indica TaxID=538381 RepID=UPI001CD48DE2|nr:UDP-N-acetylglucosamine 1-carboxyvinyltransferase [Stappia indica]MCA1299567.1 UDP-N-acetylglucosamine 1-carboxyvinyltransferase [Stappia indica]
MDRLQIEGGHRLDGSVQVAGAKNAALPILAASLLSDRDLVLGNLPAVTDVTAMLELLREFGVRIDGPRQGRLVLHATGIVNTEATWDIVRRMRASFLVLAPLVARFGHARISRPGGCSIGTRPVDLHLEALAALGASVETAGGVIDVTAPRAGGLQGGRINLAFPSVGATHTAMMAATAARGETEIVNCAREPEIVDVATCLARMGARIEGAGTHRIRVEGLTLWQPAEHMILPDRIEAGTYLIAAALTGGQVEVTGGRLEHLGGVCEVLDAAGVTVFPSDRGLIAERHGPLRSVDMTTGPFPAFPTDLQAQFMTLMTQAEGVSTIRETVFENRFMHVPELQRLGANIEHRGSVARVRGRSPLDGASVMATDLRASMCLVLAGLVARGWTTVNRVYHIDRGYEDVEGKLRRCGARIERRTGA